MRLGFFFFQTDLGKNRQKKIFICTGERKITFPQHANKRNSNEFLLLLLISK